jgi:hypothetical protein
VFIVVIYSCFTSAYYIAFEAEVKEFVIYIEHFVTAIFIMDILIKFLTVPDVEDSVTYDNHMAIAKRYLTSIQFYLDVVATFPFYLMLEPKNAQWFKLLRLARLQRVGDYLKFEVYASCLLRCCTKKGDIEE